MVPQITRKNLLEAIIDPQRSIAKVQIQEITMGPGQPAPLHLHPCPTVGVITEGRIAFQIEGRPVQHLNPGDAFYEPVNVRVARFDNEGDLPATFVVFYLLGKGDTETVHILDK
jgi:quercetin dioxygenase-like cupin family protein